MNEKIWLKKVHLYGRLCYMIEEDLEETMQLQELVIERMSNKRWLAYSSRKDFENALNNGFALVCVVEGKIIAFLQCVLNDTDYSKDRYDSEEMRSQCADYTDVFVHPDYWGNGLQNIMGEKMEVLCKQAGKSILLGTVDPDNKYSCENFRKMGYKEVDRLIKYGGLKRLLMEKKLV